MEDVLEWGPNDSREEKQDHLEWYHDLRYIWNTETVEYLRGFEVEFLEHYS